MPALPTPYHPSHHAPRTAGRFAETPAVRRLRHLFGLLQRTSPGAAALLTYALLTRPPRVAERHWQAQLRRQASNEWLTFGHGRLACSSWGQGPTVLLVHGWGARATHLGRLVLPLVAAGYRVVAFDGPGHGRSSGSFATLPDFAGAVAAVGAHAGDVHALVAHSFGVPMALWAQAGWGLRVRRQVLFSSLDDCKWVTEQFGRMVALRPDVIEQARQRAVKRSGGRLDWNRLSVGEWLRQSTHPTLLIHDVHDPEIPVQHLYNVINHCLERPLDVHMTEGLGHHRLLGDHAVIRRVVDFIGLEAP
ncbi:alpha/beta hydrolase [Ottowia sp.]|uniref:alpha/beta hydrolase n=1 Tax=Ottowia sp. TaxID=1898956 RepID=UPI00262D2FC8|nr:alpha/beta hydrolase [Ottowia sp.]